MNDPNDKEQGQMQRFVLSLWVERREEPDAPGILRGSLIRVPDGEDRAADTAPARTYFQTLDGLLPALRALLRIAE